MSDTFLTIAAPSEGFFKDQASKFISHAFPVKTSEEAMERVEEMRQKYYDSKHVCFAYRLGKNGDYHRSFDAGEPFHSAGIPILNEIRSKELTNTIVIVIRYFGGNKLGIPGLIDAYKTSAADALIHAKIVEGQATKTLDIEFPYTLTSEVNKICHHHDLKVIKADYTDICKQKLEFKESNFSQIQEIFANLGILSQEPL